MAHRVAPYVVTCATAPAARSADNDRAKQWSEWLSCPRPTSPFRMCRGAQRSADQGSRLFERSELERDPAGREHRRFSHTPERRVGTQPVGSPFGPHINSLREVSGVPLRELWWLSLGEAKKATRRRATPGPRRHQSTPSTTHWPSAKVRRRTDLKTLPSPGTYDIAQEFHRTTEPPNHQITKSPNHQTTKPPNHQTIQPSNHLTKR